jgi:hypothetical protein
MPLHDTKRQVFTNSNVTPCHQKTRVHKGHIEPYTRNKELFFFFGVNFFMAALFFVGDTRGEDEVPSSTKLKMKYLLA